MSQTTSGRLVASTWKSPLPTSGRNRGSEHRTHMVILDQGGRRRSLSTILAPPPALASVVESMWIDEWPRRTVSGAWRIVADDAPHIIWHLLDDPAGRRRDRICLVGARTTK